jgi:hypothetical protein
MAAREQEQQNRIGRHCKQKGWTPGSAFCILGGGGYKLTLAPQGGTLHSSNE